MSTLWIEVLTTTVLAITFLIALTILVLYFRDRREARYNEKTHQVQLEMLRESMERRIYDLTDRLTSKEERWLDLNHLLVSRLQTQPEQPSTLSNIPLNQFLRSYGITEDEITIDPKLVFVLTPFNPAFQKSFRAIAEACRDLNLECVRGDEVQISTDLLPHVLRLIIKAKVIIANIDGRNPNVFYELGIAHALDKTTILITSSIRGVPLDLRSKKLVVYHEPEELQLAVHKELSRIFVGSLSN